MRKEQVVRAARGKKEAEGLGVQEVDGAGDERLVPHELQRKPGALSVKTYNHSYCI